MEQSKAGCLHEHTEYERSVRGNGSAVFLARWCKDCKRCLSQHLARHGQTEFFWRLKKPGDATSRPPT